MNDLFDELRNLIQTSDGSKESMWDILTTLESIARDHDFRLRQIEAKATLARGG